MSVFSGPEIMNDNIVLYLDAKNKKSYPTSGSTWYDLSGNSNHFSLDVSGISYDPTGHFDITDGPSSYSNVSKTYYIAWSPLSTNVTPPNVTTTATCPSASDVAVTTMQHALMNSSAMNITCAPATNRFLTFNMTPGPAVRIYSDTTYTVSTTVSGNASGTQMWVRGAVAGNLSCRLFYAASDNSINYFSGAAATFAVTTSTPTVPQAVNLSAQSATVPAGARLGLEIITLTSGDRIGLGTSQQTQLSVTEVVSSPATGGGISKSGTLTSNSMTACTCVFWIKTSDTQSLFLCSSLGPSYYLGAYRVGNKYYNSNCGSPTVYTDTVQRANLYDYIIDDVWHMVEFKNVDLSTWSGLQFNKYVQYTFGSGMIGNIAIYNKVLTSDESLQNFRAFRSFYGI